MGLLAKRFVVQVLCPLIGEYPALMEEVIAAESDESEPRWTAFIHIDQMPTHRHEAEGLATQAAVLERRL